MWMYTTLMARSFLLHPTSRIIASGRIYQTTQINFFNYMLLFACRVVKISVVYPFIQFYSTRWLLRRQISLIISLLSRYAGLCHNSTTDPILILTLIQKCFFLHLSTSTIQNIVKQGINHVPICLEFCGRILSHKSSWHSFVRKVSIHKALIFKKFSLLLCMWLLLGLWWILLDIGLLHYHRWQLLCLLWFFHSLSN